MTQAIQESLKANPSTKQQGSKAKIKNQGLPKIISLSDDENVEDAIHLDESNDPQDDDEDDIYEVDEEEQTAAQVLKEANALSAKIVKIVSEWCGGEGKAKGLILGEGALALGNGGSVGNGGKQGDNNMWISKETMKRIIPNVDLAEYQLLGVNWMALLNRSTFGSGDGINQRERKNGMEDKRKVNVNGILADEMGLGKVSTGLTF